MHDGHDYVLIGRRAALAAPFGQMKQELDAALGRILMTRSHPGASRRAPGSAPGNWWCPRPVPTSAKFAAAGKTPTAPKTARALNGRSQEHHHCHRAVAARRRRLAIFRRLSADGKAARAGADQATGTGANPTGRDATESGAARRHAWRRTIRRRHTAAGARHRGARGRNRIARRRDCCLAAHRNRHAEATRQRQSQGRADRRSVAYAVSRNRRSQLAGHRAVVAFGCTGTPISQISAGYPLPARPRPCLGRIQCGRSKAQARSASIIP